ncbi:hypothetical protein AB0E56_11510 [Microbacterium sp. NPDC028030]|uniref:hypothetical protein n=1 Tax=Microbacterium sp. NPDC028030 TaxID=3155124 RepID=UPI0034013D41
MEKRNWQAVKTSGGYGVLKINGEQIKKAIIVRNAEASQVKPSGRVNAATAN